VIILDEIVVNFSCKVLQFKLSFSSVIKTIREIMVVTYRIMLNALNLNFSSNLLISEFRNTNEITKNYVPIIIIGSTEFKSKSPYFSSGVGLSLTNRRVL